MLDAKVKFTFLERQLLSSYRLQNYEALSMGIWLIYIGKHPKGRSLSCFAI